MLLDTYEQEERFWLKSLFGATSSDGLRAFRGEFVVLEGELKASAGKRAAQGHHQAGGDAGGRREAASGGR